MLLASYWVSFIAFISSSSATAVCTNNNTGLTECCQDYRNVSGSCEACIGSWGKDCNNSCEFGFYGHGCRDRCDCTQRQFCDKISGCLDVAKIRLPKNGNNEQSNKDIGGSDTLLYMALTVGVTLTVIVSWAIWFVQRKLKIKRKTGETVPGENSFSRRHDGGECIYSEVRESQMIDDSAFGPPKTYTLPIMHSDINVREMRKCKSLTRQRTEQSACPRSLDLDCFGEYNRSSDTYSHLRLKKMSSSPADSFVIGNDYGLSMHNPPKSYHKYLNAGTELESELDGYTDQT